MNNRFPRKTSHGPGLSHSSGVPELHRLILSGPSAVGPYTFVRTIGEGSFSKVKLATHRLSGMKVAVKCVDRIHAPAIVREVETWRNMHHPNIAKLYEVLVSESKIYMVTEFCDGGESFDYIYSRGRMSDDVGGVARRVFFQIVDAVRYCHDKNFVHRDLKLENILLTSTLDVKLIDFGFTRSVQTDNLLDTYCGSIAYAAPEMITASKYSGPEADIWSLGVILYTLVCGYLPFDDDNEATVRRKIVDNEYSLPDFLQEDTKELISSILKTEGQQRISIMNLLAHPWFAGLTDAPLYKDANDVCERNQPLIQSLKQSGIDSEALVNSIRTNACDSLYGLFHLLLAKDEYYRNQQALSNSIVAAAQAAAAAQGNGGRGQPPPSPKRPEVASMTSPHGTLFNNHTQSPAGSGFNSRGDSFVSNTAMNHTINHNTSNNTAQALMELQKNHHSLLHQQHIQMMQQQQQLHQHHHHGMGNGTSSPSTAPISSASSQHTLFSQQHESDSNNRFTPMNGATIEEASVGSSPVAGSVGGGFNASISSPMNGSNDSDLDMKGVETEDTQSSSNKQNSSNYLNVNGSSLSINGRSNSNSSLNSNGSNISNVSNPLRPGSGAILAAAAAAASSTSPGIQSPAQSQPLPPYPFQTSQSLGSGMGNSFSSQSLDSNNGHGRFNTSGMGGEKTAAFFGSSSPSSGRFGSAGNNSTNGFSSYGSMPSGNGMHSSMGNNNNNMMQAGPTNVLVPSTRRKSFSSLLDGGKSRAFSIGSNASSSSVSSMNGGGQGPGSAGSGSSDMNTRRGMMLGAMQRPTGGNRKNRNTVMEVEEEEEEQERD